MVDRVFGDVPGVAAGHRFSDRAALRAAGVHRPLQAGIAGGSAEGAESNVLNEGYQDDQDLGNEIIYTGEGGRDPNRGVQVPDQQLTRGNLALARSHLEGLPVRVVRGPRLQSPYAPAGAYRYDGLYAVEDHWRERGRSGFFIWRFRLRRIEGQPAASSASSSTAPAVGATAPQRTGCYDPAGCS